MASLAHPSAAPVCSWIPSTSAAALAPHGQCLRPHQPFTANTRTLAKAFHNLANPTVFFSIPILKTHANPKEMGWLQRTITAVRAAFQNPSWPKIFVRHTAHQSPYQNGLDMNSSNLLTNLLQEEITRIAQTPQINKPAAIAFAKLNVVLVDNQEMLSILGYADNGAEDHEIALASLPVWLQHDGTVILNAENALDNNQLSQNAQEALILALKLHHAQQQPELKKAFEETESNTQVLGTNNLGQIAQSVFAQSTWAEQNQTGITTPPPAYQTAASQAQAVSLASTSEGKPVRNINRLLTIAAVQNTALGLAKFFNQPPAFFLETIAKIKFETQPSPSGIAYLFGPTTEKHLELPKNVSKAFTNFSDLQEHLVLALTLARQDYRLTSCYKKGHIHDEEIIDQTKQLLPFLSKEQILSLFRDINSELGNGLGRWVASTLSPGRLTSNNAENEFVDLYDLDGMYTGALFPNSPLEPLVFKNLRKLYEPEAIAQTFFQPQEQINTSRGGNNRLRLCREHTNPTHRKERTNAYVKIMQALYEVRKSINPKNPMAVTMLELLEHSQTKPHQTIRNILQVLGADMVAWSFVNYLHRQSNFSGITVLMQMIFIPSFLVSMHFGAIPSLVHSVFMLLTIYLWLHRLDRNA